MDIYICKLLGKKTCIKVVFFHKVKTSQSFNLSLYEKKNILITGIYLMSIQTLSLCLLQCGHNAIQVINATRQYYLSHIYCVNVLSNYGLRL